MKQFLIAAVLLSTISSCIHSPDIIDKTYSPGKLKKDLLVLKDLLENVHAGVFVYINEKGFNSLFDSMTASITSALTQREFYDKVDFIIENIHCAHSDCYFPQDYFDTLLNRKYFFPIPLVKIGEKIYINTKNYNIPNGSEVFSINNNTIKEIFSKLLYHKHTDGFSKSYKDDAINVDFAYDYYIAYGISDSFSIKFRDAVTNEVVYMTVRPQTLNEVYRIADDDTYYSFPGDFYYDFKIEDDQKTALLTIRTFSQESYSQADAFENFLQNSFSLLQLKGIKNLVIDYRNNKGGYFRSSYELLHYFIAGPLRQFDSVLKRFNHLPFKDYVSAGDSSLKEHIDTSYKQYKAIAAHRYALQAPEIDTCFPAAHLFKGKLYIITNGDVISAAASSVALLKEKAGATIVGEETGGGYASFNSQVVTYLLPNSGIRVDIPTLRYYPPVTKKGNSNGVRPDYYRPLTRPDFTDFNDGPLQFILDTLIH